MQIKVQNKPAVLTNLLNRAHIAVFYKVRLRKINNDISNIKPLEDSIYSLSFKIERISKCFKSCGNFLLLIQLVSHLQMRVLKHQAAKIPVHQVAFADQRFFNTLETR